MIKILMFVAFICNYLGSNSVLHASKHRKKHNSEKESGETSISQAELEDTLTSIEQKKKKKIDSLSVLELDDWLSTKISDKLLKLVTEYDSQDNSIFQTKINQVQKNAEKIFLKKLPEYGQAGRSDELNKKHFSALWKRAMNEIHEVDSPDIEENDGSGSDLEKFSDDEQQEGEQTVQKNTIKTTLLNILLRRSGAMELEKKIQTMIENGSDKNLHKEFSSSPKMQNQKEYPLYIILHEVDDKAIRSRILKVFLDDQITYSYNHLLDEDDEALKTVLHSLGPNKGFVLESLLEKEDFVTFNDVLGYLEKSVIFITKKFHDRIAQIDDQINCTILENILQKMMRVRRKAISTSENGTPVDNIFEFFSTRKLSGQMRINGDARFSMNFQTRLSKDYESLFAKIAKRIDSTRSESELKGDDLKEFVIEWTKWANFRNRVAKHLNKFALSASNEGNKSNVIKLIRYANIYDKKSINSEEDEIFRELHDFGGAEIIFTTRNKLKWTPLMYAMYQKQSDGIQLYLRQAPHEITNTDGVDNNILHLAFPLPNKFFKEESQGDSDNVLQMVGADVGVSGSKEKTFEAIRAIITERSVSTDSKIAALTQLSASNFTPVSLAAASGYIEIYEFLVTFLKSHNAWDEDAHAHLGIHVRELVVTGLRAYKDSCQKFDNLSRDESSRIIREIESREQTLTDSTSTAIKEIYHSESMTARRYLDVLRKPAMEIMDAFYEQKSTKQKVAPYSEALTALVNEMLYPKPTIEKVKVPYKPPVFNFDLQPKPEKKKSRLKKVLGAVRLTRKKPKEAPKPPVKLPSPGPKYTEKRTPSILEGMRGSTSAVKSSYLAPVLEEITELYLRDHVSPQKMSFDALYKGLTGTEIKEFFQRKLNPTVEKKLQKVILDAMKKSGRYREEESQSPKKKNRFDDLDGDVSDVEEYSGSGSSSTSRSNSSGSDELDL